MKPSLELIDINNLINTIKQFQEDSKEFYITHINNKNSELYNNDDEFTKEEMDFYFGLIDGFVDKATVLYEHIKEQIEARD